MLNLSVEFHRENWAVQSNYVLPNSRFHQIVPLNKNFSRKPQWRRIVYILHVDKLASVLLTSLGPAFPAFSSGGLCNSNLNKLPAFDSRFYRKEHAYIVESDHCVIWKVSCIKAVNYTYFEIMNFQFLLFYFLSFFFIWVLSYDTLHTGRSETTLWDQIFVLEIIFRVFHRTHILQ